MWKVLKFYKLSVKAKRSSYRRRKRFYDFETLYPIQHFKVDLKEIHDATTPSEETLRREKGLNFPPHQGQL